MNIRTHPLKVLIAGLVLSLTGLLGNYSASTADVRPKAASESAIPADFIRDYYAAYSGRPRAARLAPFYAEDVVLEDPTFDFTGRGKKAIFENFDQANLPNEYQWQIAQQIGEGERLVTEGILRARYHGRPYTMRFVNIFHFRQGKIIRQYDYYDNAEYFKVVKAWEQRGQPAR